MEKHNYEYIKEYIESFNYSLLSDSYINSKTKIKLKCLNSHIFETTFNVFQRGFRCSACSGKLKYKYDYVKDYIESFGYILLSEKYKNTDDTLNTICINGHNYYTSFYLFKKGHRCQICYHDNNTGENNPKWKKDRTRKDRSKNLIFPKRNIFLLKDDNNFNDYILNSSKYEIDHIFPRIAFIDYNIDNYPKLVKELCNHPSNLKIIYKQENRSKCNKYNKEEFFDYLKHFK